VNEDDLAEQMTTDLAARFALSLASGGLGYSNQTQLEWGKFNEIGPSGGYADETTTHMFELTTPVVAAAAPGAMVPQVAWAVSWNTANARGYASKGRIFVPMPSVTPSSSTGKVSAANCLSAAQNWGFLIDEWNDLSGLDLSDIKASVVSNVPLEGATNEITAVRVGDVLDTMRSRRNALTESYSTAPVEAAP
jgi:hypothetical protein